MTKSCYELCGIECGKGWRKIIEPLIELCKRENVTILQIKEKFGTLRFYVGAASDEVHAAIHAAEEASETICENCGEPGTRRDTGWIRTLCDECTAKQ